MCNISGSDSKVVLLSPQQSCVALKIEEKLEKTPRAPNSTFPKVEYLCEHEYVTDDRSVWINVLNASIIIDAFSENNTGHVWVVGAGIHVMS